MERAFFACEALGISKEKIEKLSWINRINIFPSVDWAITLYHKDYSLNRDSWMIRKIPITSPQKIINSTQSKDIIYLNELISSSRERIELN